MTKEELMKKIEDLCHEYQTDFGFMVIIETNKQGDFMIAGNLCPQCARSLLQQYCVTKNIRHHPYDPHVH